MEGITKLDKNSKISDCIEKIEKWFRFDTITLLDNVLTDDVSDPQFSANTVYGRLESIVEFQKLYFDSDIKDVNDFLFKNGYMNDDIEKLKRKCIDENERYK